MKERFLQIFKDKDFEEIFKKGGISFFIRIGGQALGFLLTLLIAQNFGAKTLGDYALAIVVLRIFTLISKLGMDIFLVRFISSFVKKGKWKSIILVRAKVIIIASITSIISSLIMFFYANQISALLNTNYEHIRISAFFVLPMTFFMLNYQSLREFY